jgi:hypothetical protein
MKQFLFLFVCVFVVAGSAQKENKTFFEKSLIFKYFRLGLNANFFNSLKLISGPDQITFTPYNSLSATIEFYNKNSAEVIYGFGGSYHPPAKIKGVNEDLGTIGNVTAYSYLDYPISIGQTLNPFISVRLGYGFISTSGYLDKKAPGIYHAFGFSLPISNKLWLHILFSNQYGEVRIGSDEYYINFSSLNFGLLL